jgi:hypothetical protein
MMAHGMMIEKACEALGAKLDGYVAKIAAVALDVGGTVRTPSPEYQSIAGM